MRTQQREHRGNRRRRRRCGDGGRWPVRRTLVFIFFFFFLAAIVEEEARVCFYPIISHWLFFYQIRTEREREKEIRSCAEFGSVEGRKKKKKKKKITPGNELRHAPAPYGRRRHDGTDLDTSASRLRVTFSFTVLRKLAAPLGIGLYVSLECVCARSVTHPEMDGTAAKFPCPLTENHAPGLPPSSYFNFRRGEIQLIP